FWVRSEVGRGVLLCWIGECWFLVLIAADAEHRALGVLEDAGNDELSGHLDVADAAGRAVLQIRDLRARFHGAAERPARSPGPAPVPAAAAAAGRDTYIIGELPEVAELRAR